MAKEEEEEEEPAEDSLPMNDQLAWDHLRKTTEARLRETEDAELPFPPEPSLAPVLAFLDETCDATGHDWVNSMDNLQCLRCGLKLYNPTHQMSNPSL